MFNAVMFNAVMFNALTLYLAVASKSVYISYNTRYNFITQCNSKATTLSNRLFYPQGRGPL